MTHSTKRILTVISLLVGGIGGGFAFKWYNCLGGS
jgi:hypothetical protein